MTYIRITAGGIGALALSMLALPAMGQESVGRGWPVQPATYPFERLACPPGTPQDQQETCEAIPTVPMSTVNNLSAADIAAGATIETHGGQGPDDGSAPPGWERLERDIFNSPDFYQDLEAGLWEDPAYFRCLAAAPLAYAFGANPSSIRLDPEDPYGTARWGDCNVDYPREAIVSPYGFETAQEHYEALLAETEANGTRVNYSYENPPPDWSGRYMRAAATPEMPQWYAGNQVQVPTQLSLLTPEYRMRNLQEFYHAANTNVTHWPSQYCWPEGFMRRYQGPSVRDHHIFMTPQSMLMMAGVADNFVQQIFFDREFDLTGATPRLGADVPRWYGETVGFWDDETLITWTANVQGWFTHDWWEHSNQLETIEIYDPIHDADGNYTGLIHETIFYDPEALLEPVRLVRQFDRTDQFDTAIPYVFIDCIQTIYPVDGRPTQTTPGQIIEYEVPDMFGRPWAHWFSMFEEGMDRPEAESGLFGF